MSVLPQTLHWRARQITVMEKRGQCLPVTYALHTSFAKYGQRQRKENQEGSEEGR